MSFNTVLLSCHSSQFGSSSVSPDWQWSAVMLKVDILTTRENKIKQKKISAVWGIFSVTGCYCIIWSTVQSQKYSSCHGGKFWILTITLDNPPLISLNFVLYVQQTSLKPFITFSHLRDLRVGGMWAPPQQGFGCLCLHKFSKKWRMRFVMLLGMVNQEQMGSFLPPSRFHTYLGLYPEPSLSLVVVLVALRSSSWETAERQWVSVLFISFSDKSGWQMGSLNCLKIHVVLLGT